MRRFLRLLSLVAVLAAGCAVTTPAMLTGHGSVLGAPAAGDGFGDAADLGSMRGQALAQGVVGMAATPSGNGYWLVARDGGIFSFGDAHFLGSTGAIHLNQPVVGMAATPSGNGYWFVAADGGIFSFGDAGFAGSTGAMTLSQPIVGMAATPSGNGYWLVARDGGVFSFGDATFAGSAAGSVPGPITGLIPTPSGHGYWLGASDGRVLSFGDAAALPVNGRSFGGPVVGLAATPDGSGYWTAASGGGVTAFGTATSYGTPDASSPVVGIVRTPSGRGYWLVTSDGSVLTRVGAATIGAYSFLAKDGSGRPTRYDPCRPVRYVINPAGAPDGAVDEVRESFRRVGAAIGVSFEDAGTTPETHLPIGGTATRRSYQPERYGIGQWAPILVSWASDTDEPVLAGATLGYGGSTSSWLKSSDQAYVTGEVVFDRDLSLLRPGFGPGLTRGNLVQHELGHVAGLDHVQDRGQEMFPSISDRSPDGYGAGDRAGLAQLGAQSGCLRTASPVGGLL